MKQSTLVKMCILLPLIAGCLTSLHLVSQAKTKTLQQKPTIPFIKLPDLTVSFPKLPLQKQKIPTWKRSKGIRVKVKNIGAAPAKDFFLDFILSTNTYALVKYAVYSPFFHEDVLLKGGRMHIDSLAAGAAVTITLPAPIHLPKNIPPGTLYIGTVVDPGKKVTESNEKNNTAFLKYRSILQAHIDKVQEVSVWSSGSGNVELIIRGANFGHTRGNKNAKLGTHVLGIDGAYGHWEWYDNVIYAIVSANIPFGEYYNVYLVENNQVISNKKKILLKIDVESCYRQVGNGYQSDGQVGSNLEIHGTGFGASQGAKQIQFGPLVVPATSWGNYRVRLVCPNLPPGHYEVYIKKGGLDISLKRVPFQVLPN